MSFGVKVSRELEQLLQFLKGPVFDGNLISKTARDKLEASGLIFQVNGYQSLTENGVILLERIGYLPEAR